MDVIRKQIIAKKLPLLVVLCMIIVLSGCKEEIDIFDFGEESRLVVDGYITDVLQQQEIRLTYSSAFEDGIFIPEFEPDARVFVLDDMGNEISFEHVDQGRYLSSPFAASSDRSYQLVVQVNEKTYTSTSQTIPSLAPKAEVSFTRGVRDVLSESGRLIVPEEGIVISAAVQATSSPGYYHWVFDNYHKYVAAGFVENVDFWSGAINMDSYQGYDFLTPEQRDTLAASRDPLAETCYLKNLPDAQVVILENTANASGGSNFDVEIDFIKRDQKFIFDYAIRARQLITDQNSFLYWESIRDQLENVGSLFDAASSSIQGNVTNQSTGEFVLGYFGVYREYSDTFFFNDEELGFEPQTLFCNTEDRAFLHLAQVLGPENEQKPWGDCISCLERGGAISATHRKPDWWR